MTSPPVKATNALYKPPAAKPIQRGCISDNVYTTRSNASYKKVYSQFMKQGDHQMHH